MYVLTQRHKKLIENYCDKNYRSAKTKQKLFNVFKKTDTVLIYLFDIIFSRTTWLEFLASGEIVYDIPGVEGQLTSNRFHLPLRNRHYFSPPSFLSIS